MGTYRRRIRLTARPGSCVGELEDDFHHFRSTVLHDGEQVLDVTGEGVRYPWSTCPAAAAALRQLVGMRLTASAVAHGKVGVARENCTHLFDLTGFVLAHAHAHLAGERAATRVYDIDVDDAEAGAGGLRRARVRCDDAPVLDWQMRYTEVLGPPPYDRADLRGAFLVWAEETLPADEAEAAIALRRATMIAIGRSMDLDAIDVADELGDQMIGSCHTFREPTIHVALRMKGSARDFTDRPQALLA